MIRESTGRSLNKFRSTTQFCGAHMSKFWPQRPSGGGCNIRSLKAILLLFKILCFVFQVAETTIAEEDAQDALCQRCQ